MVRGNKRRMTFVIPPESGTLKWRYYYSHVEFIGVFMSIDSWVKERAALVDVAMGRAPADVVLRDGQWLCVQSGEILPHTDVAIKGERIAYVGPDAKHAIGPKTRVIEAKGRFLSPGLMDAHLHIESSMVTITEYVRAVVPHGSPESLIPL